MKVLVAASLTRLPLQAKMSERKLGDTKRTWVVKHAMARRYTDMHRCAGKAQTLTVDWTYRKEWREIHGGRGGGGGVSFLQFCLNRLLGGSTVLFRTSYLAIDVL